MNITCSDESKKTRDITGTVSVIEEDTADSSNKKAPKIFTITTASEYTYKFRKVTGNTDGKLQYECIGCVYKNGEDYYQQEYTTGNIYTCTMGNGQPVLKQTSGMEGYGSGLLLII